MRTHFIAIAALVGGSLTLNAQNPQSPQAPQQQQQQAPAETRGGDTTQRDAQNAGTQTITVIGCLKAEKDVPGRRPNMAERAGVGNDFVLTNVKMAQGSTTSGIGLVSMYEIEGIAEAELQKHINHQVEITGTLSRGDAQGNRGTGATGAAGAAGAAGANNRQDNQAGVNADLPELNGISMKMVAASCPAAQ